MPPDNRTNGPAAHVVPVLFVVGAVAAFFIEGATLAQVVVPTGVALAVGVFVTLLASRVRRFRGAQLLVGWAVAAFLPAALVAEPTVEPFAAALLYVPVVLWSSLFFDIKPETFRGGERHDRSGGDAGQ